MMAPWRPIAFAAALNLTVVVGVTTAQTVMVTKAPRGATIELALNAATIGTATADATGKATLPVNLSSHGGRTEADVQVFVDVCGDVRRVVLVEPGLQAQPPQIGCTRKELAGVFLMRQVTTLVVEVTATSPAVWLRQGPVPTEWLGEDSGRISTRGQRRPSPTGLILFGGGGLATYANVGAVACGTVTTCTGSESRLGYGGGATVWVTQFLGVEGSYDRSRDVVLSGSGPYYRFTSSLNSNTLTAVGKVALPLGPVRLYAQVGADRHQATFTTTQTSDARVVLAEDGTETTIVGGTQKFVLRTAGWGLAYGGGIEVWMGRKLGMYAEFERRTLKGASRDGDPGKLDDRITAFNIGIRLHLFGG